MEREGCWEMRWRRMKGCLAGAKHRSWLLDWLLRACFVGLFSFTSASMLILGMLRTGASVEGFRLQEHPFRRVCACTWKIFFLFRFGLWTCFAQYPFRFALFFFLRFLDVGNCYRGAEEEDSSLLSTKSKFEGVLSMSCLSVCEVRKRRDVCLYSMDVLNTVRATEN